MVGTDPLHLVAAVLYATPEISAADNDPHLDTEIHTCLLYTSRCV